MYIIIAKSESGDDYIFKSQHALNSFEWDKFIENNYPNELDEDGFNYVYIINQYHIDNIEEIK